MATGEVQAGQASWQDMLFGAGRDALSSAIDTYRARSAASTQERLVRAQGEQDRQLRTTELQYQNRNNPIDVRSGAVQPVAGLPVWVWGAGGVAAVLLVGWSA